MLCSKPGGTPRSTSPRALVVLGERKSGSCERTGIWLPGSEPASFLCSRRSPPGRLPAACSGYLVCQPSGAAACTSTRTLRVGQGVCVCVSVRGGCKSGSRIASQYVQVCVRTCVYLYLCDHIYVSACVSMTVLMCVC